MFVCHSGRWNIINKEDYVLLPHHYYLVLVLDLIKDSCPYCFSQVG